MRVLMLPSWYPHSNDALAGIFVRRQIEAVAPRCSVAVLSVVADPNVPLDGFRIDAADEHGVYTVRVRFGSSQSAYAPDQAASCHHIQAARTGLAHVLRDWGRADLCHVHVLPHSGPIALEMRARFATPYVVSEHWSGYFRADGRYAASPNRTLTEQVVAKASGVATVSNALRDAMCGHGLASTYRVVPNVVPPRPEVAAPASDATGLRLLCVARLDDGEKNLSGLLQALAMLSPARQAGIRLDIVGGGPDRQRLEQIRCDLGLEERVRFHGERPNSEIGGWIERAHMIVCNSWFETFSISTAEALVHGRPVIATACGGPADYLDPAWALIVPPGDVEALARALDRAPGAFPRLAHAAEHSFDGRRFRSEAVGAQLLDLYQTALHGARDRVVTTRVGTVA